jgi:DNA-directed RNA polymerase specialized sigma24 family protein
MNDWDRIVREHGPTVFATVWHILGHREETDEVVQEVFRKARGAAAEEAGCRRMLRQLAVGAALDRLRLRPAAQQRQGNVAGRLRAGLALLPGCEAAVFSLHYFEDLSCEEIAETLQLNGVAIVGALDRARARLEALLLPEEAPPAEQPQTRALRSPGVGGLYSSRSAAPASG